MSRNTSVFGIYSSASEVAEAVAQLRAAGFFQADVSVLYSENAGNKDLVHEKNTKAPEGAAAGGTSGAVVGGAVGALAVPGLAPLVAAGPVIAMSYQR
jgi:hypothetical protein